MSVSFAQLVPTWRIYSTPEDSFEYSLLWRKGAAYEHLARLRQLLLTMDAEQRRQWYLYWWPVPDEFLEWVATTVTQQGEDEPQFEEELQELINLRTIRGDGQPPSE